MAGSEVHGDAVVLVRPELLDQPVFLLHLPFVLKEGADCLAALDEVVPVPPAAGATEWPSRLG